MTEPLLLTCTQVSTFDRRQRLTQASGFFFERDGRLYLVTSRHVLRNPSSGHFPDHIEIGFHTGLQDLTQSCGLSIPLYRNGLALWHQGRDGAGEIDVVRPRWWWVFRWVFRTAGTICRCSARR